METFRLFAVSIALSTLTYFFCSYVKDIEKSELLDKIKELEYQNNEIQCRLDSVQTKYFICDDEINNFRLTLFYLKEEYPEASIRFDSLLRVEKDF